MGEGGALVVQREALVADGDGDEQRPWRQLGALLFPGRFDRLVPGLVVIRVCWRKPISEWEAENPERFSMRAIGDDESGGAESGSQHGAQAERPLGAVNSPRSRATG